MKRMLFILLAMSIGATFVSPLFPIYSEHYGLSSLEVTALFAIYAVFLLPTLMITGSKGHVWGLKRTIRISLALSILATIIFVVSNQAWLLYTARLVEGIAYGAFTGTASAFLLSNSAKDKLGTALKASGIAVSVGFGLGPALTGLLIQYLPFKPLQIPFWVLSVVLLIAWAVLETLPSDKPQLEKASQSRISLGVPKDIQKPFWSFVAPSIFIVFTLNGIVLSLIPSFAKNVIHTTNLSVSGLLILLLLGGGAMTQLLPWPSNPVTRLRIGIILQITGAWVIVISGEQSNLLLLWLGILFQTFGSAWMFQASLHLAGALSSPQTRSKIISTYYFAAYTGFVVPSLGVGILTLFVSLNTSLVILDTAVTLLVVYVVIYSVPFRSFYKRLMLREA